MEIDSERKEIWGKTRSGNIITRRFGRKDGWMDQLMGEQPQMSVYHTTIKYSILAILLELWERPYANENVFAFHGDFVIQ